MAKGLRILELCLSNGKGGLELYVADIVEKLRARGWSVQSITRKHTFLSEALKGERNSTIDQPNALGLLFVAKRIARQIESGAVDILHINWGHDLPLAVMAKRLARSEIKLIYSRHMRITRKKHDYYHKFFYQHVDALTITTQRLLAEARDNLPMEPGDLYYLPYGIDPPASTGDCTALLGENERVSNGLNIGCFSRREHAKGQHVLLEAVRQLHLQGIGFELVFVGHVMDSAYEDGLRNRVERYGLSGQIRFVDFVDQPMRVMPCFDVIVLPTYEETFGLVLAEAIHMGVAVMGTNAGGVPEIIKHEQTGLLFEPGDHTELANGLKRLHEDPELRASLAERGRRWVQEHYSERAHMENLESLLSSLCPQVQSSPATA